MFSYWEQQSFLKYDHIVVGAGITGLSNAIELRTLYPNDSVLVLERGMIPAGASTRNAGFACMGSVTELLDDLETMQESEVVALFQQRKTGLQLLRKRLNDSAIGYASNGSYELIDENAKEALNHIDYLNKLLLPINNKESFCVVDRKISEFGFAAQYTKALIENICEGEINTGKMMHALANFAVQNGVEIKTGAQVAQFEEGNGGVVVTVNNPYGESYRLQCSTLNICTNAFTKQLLPGEDITPGRGQVLVTKPIDGLKFKGVYHFDKGYYYFREIDGRILIGGGRNLDFEAENTDHVAVTKMIQGNLETKLQEVIIPGVAYEVEHRWAGIMAFGKNKQPIIKAFSNRVFGAFRFGGMGVALGSEAARQLAELNIESR